MRRRAGIVPLVLATAVALAGMGCDHSDDASTPTPTATFLPTAEPATPTAGPATRTGSIPTTPEAITPTPAQSLRPDCPTDWAAYEDPEGYFSVCYPADWDALWAPPRAHRGTLFQVLRPLQWESLTVYRLEPSSSASSICKEQERRIPVVRWEDLNEQSLDIAGRTVIACVGYQALHGSETGTIYIPGTFAEVPLGDDKGYVALLAMGYPAADGAGVSELPAVLQTLRLGQAP